VSKHSR